MLMPQLLVLSPAERGEDKTRKEMAARERKGAKREREREGRKIKETDNEGEEKEKDGEEM